jgi:hypothetical protein
MRIYYETEGFSGDRELLGTAPDAQVIPAVGTCVIMPNPDGALDMDEGEPEIYWKVVAVEHDIGAGHYNVVMEPAEPFRGWVPACTCPTPLQEDAAARYCGDCGHRLAPALRRREAARAQRGVG